MTTARLAIEGGDPAYSLSPPIWPPQDDDVREALLRAYADGSWGKYDGPHLQQLARLLAAMHQVSFAIPCCSGTFAVELALRGLRIEPPAEVILAGYDFSGNFRAIEAIGATPVLVDISPRNCCLAADQVEAAITDQTRAIIASHLHGGIADMRRLRSIADRHGIALIEDACQAPGAMIQGRVAGTWGDVGVLSFGGSKLLTAGRGGAILTNQESVGQRAKVYCERGNHAYPLSELQAAVLIPQLAKLADRNDRRRQTVTRLLAQTTGSIPALQVMMEQPEESVASYYKVAWRYDSCHCGGWTR
jgi:dTDP-4-amino-4,6-dideoxygalactose transaminase